MRPILSIIIALFITILFTISITILNLLGIHLGFFTLVIFFLGGVIATWYSTENKIIYSVYYGVIFAFIYSFFTSSILQNDFILMLILISGLAGFGGFIAKKIRK